MHWYSKSSSLSRCVFHRDEPLLPCLLHRWGKKGILDENCGLRYVHSLFPQVPARERRSAQDAPPLSSAQTELSTQTELSAQTETGYYFGLLSGAGVDQTRFTFWSFTQSLFVRYQATIQAFEEDI